METFNLDPRCWWIGRIVGRNPLLRRADRIEAVVTLVALVVYLLAVPVAGLVGEAVYGSRYNRYAAEAHERHALAATVIGVDGSDTRIAQARWPVGFGERTGCVPLTTAAKVGDQVEIWVDENGNPVAAPTPTSRAMVDAIGTAEVTLLAVGFALAFVVRVARSRLDRTRDGQWERELRCLQEDGGRKNQH